MITLVLLLAVWQEEPTPDYFFIIPYRRRVKTNEFFYEGLSPREINEFFVYDEKQLPDDDSVPPLWSCNETNRSTRLVYLHLVPNSIASLTWGAMVRGFAEFCHAGLQVVTDCVDLSLANVGGDDIWRNNMMSLKPNMPCPVAYSANRTAYKTRGGVVTTERLAQYDILSGQIPLHEGYWPENQQRYLAILGQPLHRLSREIVFGENFTSFNSTLPSIDEAATMVANRLSQVNQGQHADQFSQYFITPAEKEYVIRENILWTAQQRTDLSLKNLVRHKVIIGMEERSDATLHMFRYLLDHDFELDSMFTFFRNASEVMQVRVELAAQKFTQAVVKRILSNSTLKERAKDYLKFDEQIYQVALQRHERQLEWIERHWKPQETSFS